MAVKMRPTLARTKRPRGALLQLGTDNVLEIVENRRESCALREASVEYLSFQVQSLTRQFGGDHAWWAV